ncbi:MAG TPA: hypothetical protein EYQ12_08635 [Oceanospirillaceae bacterium]|jgi:outer membrane lipopolysaccharide assembly protein LptE/RlpB|nr:hypothetical protein [Oceanospirillaceae bacterium]
MKTIASQFISKLTFKLALVCISVLLGSCGFHLQGQSQAAYPATLSLYSNDTQLSAQVAALLAQQQVEIESVEALNTQPLLRPQLSLTQTLQNRAELILDQNGDVTVWRYTLTTHYLYQTADNADQAYISGLPLSVSTDVDLSGGQATVNQRIEADSWDLLYRQLASRVMRQLSRQQ